MLRNVNLTIRRGEFVGIIGHTGSGKSTLIQHFNGLLRATSGSVLFDGEDIFSEGYDRRRLRGRVGLVFQYPEHQLFETSVFEDVCFGPRNQGLSEEEIRERAVHALRLVGMEEAFDSRSPFELSGGQKRRVAIAGVLAMQPEFLILDEPTAGLDPGGRDEIFAVLRQLHEQEGIAVILVSHSMEDVANYVERILVLNDGTILYDGTPREVFRHYRRLEEVGLSAPQVTYIAKELRSRGVMVEESVTTVAEAKEAILRALGPKAGKAGAHV